MSSVMIGVISDHAARYTWFSQSLAALDFDADRDTIAWRVGANRGALREALVQDCLERGYDWLFMVDDDQVFQADTLSRLLAWKQPVVSALILQRGAPFLPTAYASHEDGKFSPLDLRSVKPGLVSVAGVGTGALLVQNTVLRQLDDGRPRFLYTEDYGEDLYFSNRCEEAGIPMFLDTSCAVGHVLPAAVIPAWLSDRWGIGIQLAEGTSTVIEMNHT